MDGSTDTMGMEYGAFERSTMPEQIANRLLDMVQDRKLKPGDKLPSERELAAVMRVSRPSLREALRALAMMGVVSIRQGAGVYVSSLKPERLVEHIEFVFSTDDSTFLELFHARRMLEVGIAELAADRITDEELVKLEDCQARFRANPVDIQNGIELDLEFHKQILGAARNTIIARFMASVSQLSLASRRRTFHMPGVPEQSVVDHEAILQALKAHDPLGARQAMIEHLSHIEQKLRTFSTQP